MDVEESIMTITPAEREFFAEDEKVVIMPNFTGGMINLIAGNFGPFQPQMKVEVPLWLAVALKKRNRCNIQVSLAFVHFHRTCMLFVTKMNVNRSNHET